MTGMERIVLGARKESDWRVKKDKEATTSRANSKDGGDETTAARSINAAEPNKEEWPQTLFECAAQEQPKQQLPSFFTEQKKKNAEELMTVRHYQEKGGRNVTEIESMDGTITRFVFTKRINYSASGDVGRLARFTNVSSVHSFIGGLRAYMNQISRDPYLDKSEVQSAIAQMKGVLRRADRKVQDLNTEDALESVRRRALENEKRKKAAEIADELKRRRLERKLREYEGSSVRGPRPDITTNLSYEVEQRREEAQIEAEMAAPDTVDAAFVEAAAAAEMAAVASAATAKSGGGETASAEVSAVAVDVRV